jgi:hypothetical protein
MAAYGAIRSAAGRVRFQGEPVTRLAGERMNAIQAIKMMFMA